MTRQEVYDKRGYRYEIDKARLVRVVYHWLLLWDELKNLLKPGRVA